MRVLVACEYSARVRDAFRARGHDAWSCDLLPCEGDPRWHRQGDVRPVIAEDWDLMIAHPPCTYLANSGVRWLATKPGRREQMQEAAAFFRSLLDAEVPRVCIENPIIHRYAAEIIGRRQDQVIQPWMFGHGETKATCLWLRGLEPLQPTNVVEGREARVWKMSPGPDRWKERSRTFEGIAQAMAEQWG